MEMKEFMILSEQDKIDLVYKNGEYIGKNKNEQARSLLYKLGDFYVELQYKHYRKEIEDIDCFQSEDRARPYLEQS